MFHVQASRNMYTTYKVHITGKNRGLLNLQRLVQLAKCKLFVCLLLSFDYKNPIINVHWTSYFTHLLYCTAPVHRSELK